MKIFVSLRDIRENGADADGYMLLPDTALTPHGMPVFLPDFAAGWQLRRLTAFRIGRLGKTIGVRFAPRYIDAVTAGALLVPAPGCTGIPAECFSACFDSALTLGDWLTMENAPEEIAEAAAQAVAEISRYCTLRTGDIIIPRVDAGGPEARIGLEMPLSLGDRPVRRLRVK